MTLLAQVLAIVVEEVVVTQIPKGKLVAPFVKRQVMVTMGVEQLVINIFLSEEEIILFTVIGIIWLIGSVSSKTKKKHGEFLEGVFSSKKIYCSDEDNNLYLDGENNDYSSFPFHNILKYEVLDIKNYDSFKGAVRGGFWAGDIGAYAGSKGDDEIMIAIIWLSEKKSLMKLEKNDYLKN